MQAMTVYARHEHGGFPVHLGMGSNPTFEVLWPGGAESYPSSSAMMRALYGKDRAPGISVTRYFRLDKPVVIPRVTVFDLFADTPDPEKGHPLIKQVTPKLVKPPTKPRIIRSAPVRPVPALGIDLERRGHEVRKLLFAGFGARIYRSGFDPDDVLQEVYRGILARNHGTCPWDPAKSSFGHYVHMVCECILNNYHRKKKRIATHEQIGMKISPQQGGTEEFGLINDVALGAVNEPDFMVSDPDDDVSADLARMDIMQAIHRHGKSGKRLRPEAELALKVLPLVEQGMQRAEIAKHLGVSSGRAGKAIAFLRRTTEAWAMEVGLR